MGSFECKFLIVITLFSDNCKIFVIVKKEERSLSLKSVVLVALFRLSFVKVDPQVKTTVINITLTTIKRMVAINGETDLIFLEKNMI